MMRGIGGLLIMLGAGSFLLNMFDRQFILIMWIDNWGPTVGMIIRIAMIILGIGIVAVSSGDEE